MTRALPEALPMRPSWALRCVVRNTWRRLRCRHLPIDEDGYGYARCCLCGSWVPL